MSLPNLNPISEPTQIPIPLDYEIESLIMESHIPLMDHECKLRFFDLEPTIESKLTLKPELDFFELVLVPEPLVFESKSTIYLSHILLLDQGVDNYNSKMIFQN